MYLDKTVGMFPVAQTTESDIRLKCRFDYQLRRQQPFPSPEAPAA